ncbi:MULTISPECIES: Hint domain-containing protein [Ralstonia solanacearum species complex]|nr:hypothetical protein [Ralstonia solanacearum]CCF97244.1 hypothetical protein RSK60_1950005 [Ralstonia solanacearum K60]
MCPTPVSERVEQMFDALPGLHDSPPGIAARTGLVSALMGALTGDSVEIRGFFTGRGPSWRSIFFSGYQPAPYADAAAGVTGIGASDWSDGATATLCQSIHQLTSEARRNVDRGKADGAVDRFNGLLQQGQRLLNWYGYVFQRNWQAFATPFNAVAGDVSAKSDALAQYRAALTSPAWLGAKRLQLARGQWQNPEWELFHHYVKLLALGDSVGSIDTLIGTMGQQLSIPSTVAAGAWPAYRVWMQRPVEGVRVQIGHDDFDGPAGGGILRSTTFMPPPPPRGFSFPVTIKEGHSKNFLSDGDGRRYRYDPPSSCFRAGTPVLMAEGSPRAIETLRPGDCIATPAGPRAVALVSNALRGDRQFYALNGGAVSFTASHPFVNAANPGGASEPGNPPYLYAVRPSSLGQVVPTLSRFGVAELGPGVTLLGWRDGGAEPIPVTSVDAVAAPADPTELVYDVIVASEAAEPFQYIVADGERHYVVAAEMPLVDRVPLATRALIDVVRAAQTVLHQDYLQLERADFNEVIKRFADAAASTILTQAIRQMPPVATAALPAEPDVDQNVDSVLASLTGGGGAAAYDWVVGKTYEAAAMLLGDQIDAAIRLGYRRFDVDYQPGHPMAALAVSLHDVSFHEWAAPPQDVRVSVAPVRRGVTFDPPVLAEREDGPPAPFVRHIDTITYATDLSGTDGSTGIDFEVRFDRDAAPRYLATGHVLLPPDGPYRSYRARMRDLDGKPVGTLTFDIRPLTAELLRQERVAANFYTPDRAEAFAGELGPAMGSAFRDLLASLWETRTTATV